MSQLSKGSSMLARSAGEVKNYRFLKKIVPLMMACVAILVVIVYLISITYTKFGSFTVSVNKFQQLKYGLSLSETPDFNKPTTHLNCHAAEDITNISGSSLDGIDFGAVNGVNNGTNYVCYTFYCKNTGKEPVSFEYSINMSSMTMGIEKAARVRVITSINGGETTTVDYARAKGVDENNNQIPEEGTTCFATKNIVVQKEVDDFNPEDMFKFTVVIWLEGDDEDCIDPIIGGQLKLDMKFSITSASDI